MIHSINFPAHSPLTNHQSPHDIQKKLVVDELTCEKLGLENCIVLYPSCRRNVPWSISIDEYYSLNKNLTLLVDDISEYLTSLPILPLRASHDAAMKLVRANTALIMYILTERVIRLLKFLAIEEASSFCLPEVRSFEPPSTTRELYALARDSWEFNQYIVNEFLPDNEKVPIPGKDDVFPEGCWNVSKWSNYDEFNYRREHVSAIHKFKTLLKNPINILSDKCIELLHEKMKILSSFGKLTPIMGLGYSEKYFLNHGFFWPFGKFCKLPASLPDISWNNADLKSREDLSVRTSKHFIDGMVKLLAKMGITNSSAVSLKNISRLFFRFFPVSMLEDSEIYGAWSLEQFKKARNKNYLTWNTAGDDLSIYYNFAAVDEGFTIWGMQHSAWGGYLANVPNIAELSITGTDYYITSGWTHPEPHLPTWKTSAMPLSSPHYSELQKKARLKKRRVKVTGDHSVLLAVGQINRFPVIHAGTHYMDTLKLWADTIETIIRLLAADGIHVKLKIYASKDIRQLENSGVLDKWLAVSKENVSLCNNIQKGSAMTLFDEVDATIWDIPSGGFVESVLNGTPAFSLCCSELIRIQPEAKVTIDSLIEAGIFNQTAEELAANINRCLRATEWWYAPERKKALDTFLSDFVRLDPGWATEWKNFLAKKF